MTKKILYLTQYYARPGQPGAMRHYAHTQRLAEEGYEVTLITSYVKNSQRVIPPEYEGKRIVEEKDGAVRVYKVYAYPHYGLDFFSRMRNYLSFAVYATIAGLRASECDVVVASSPSLFSGVVGYMLSRMKRASFILEVRDLWPQAAVIMGVLRNRIVIWLGEALARFLYRKADRIVAVTRGIQEAIVAEGMRPEKIHLITNGVDTELFMIPRHKESTALRRQMAWDGKFVALYVGTLARSDGLETIVKTAKLLEAAQGVQFVFLGAGEAKQKLIDLAGTLGLANVTFLPPEPKERVSTYIQAADICLLPCRGDPFFGIVLPNKLFDYLAAGAAVIASVPTGETQELVEEAGAGVVVPAEDPDAFARAVLELRSQPERRKAMGENGRRYIFQNYQRRTLAGKLVAILKDVSWKGGSRNPANLQSG